MISRAMAVTTVTIQEAVLVGKKLQWRNAAQVEVYVKIKDHPAFHTIKMGMDVRLRSRFRTVGHVVRIVNVRLAPVVAAVAARRADLLDATPAIVLVAVEAALPATIFPATSVMRV